MDIKRKEKFILRSINPSNDIQQCSEQRAAAEKTLLPTLLASSGLPKASHSSWLNTLKGTLTWVRMQPSQTNAAARAASSSSDGPGSGDIFLCKTCLR